MGLEPMTLRLESGIVGMAAHAGFFHTQNFMNGIRSFGRSIILASLAYPPDKICTNPGAEEQERGVGFGIFIFEHIWYV